MIGTRRNVSIEYSSSVKSYLTAFPTESVKKKFHSKYIKCSASYIYTGGFFLIFLSTLFNTVSSAAPQIPLAGEML